MSNNWNVVFNVESGMIISVLPISQSVDRFYENYPIEFKNNLGTIEVSEPPHRVRDYKVVNGELIKMDALEINEIQLYKRILTEDERYEINLLNELYPTSDEIRKAENTIEILSILQEVM